jgi:exonuclease 3'-5' domain-containing protein 1
MSEAILKAMQMTGTRVINTSQSVAELADKLVSIHKLRRKKALPKPVIYIDLEGLNLCREGSVSILTLLIDLETLPKEVYLIDVHTLGKEAFDTAGVGETTLKDILQDEEILKVLFDVRNDSDALFSHFGIALQGVEDVQLMESATWETTGSRRYLNGLKKCVEKNMAGGSAEHRVKWLKDKNAGERLFEADHKVFNERPIPAPIIAYCEGDVRCLPQLRNGLVLGRSQQWHDLVLDETKKRVASTHAPDYQPHGKDRALAPWSSEQNTALDRMNYKPTMEEYLDNYDLYHMDDDDDDYDYYDDDDYY